MVESPLTVSPVHFSKLFPNTNLSLQPGYCRHCAHLRNDPWLEAECLAIHSPSDLTPGHSWSTQSLFPHGSCSFLLQAVLTPAFSLPIIPNAEFSGT